MPASLRSILWRVLHLGRRRRIETDLEGELAFHVEMETAANVSQGMTPDEARRRALISLGGVAQTTEAYRETYGLRWLGEFVQDVRYACRLMARSPRFTGLAVLTLALGIGVNTAVFSAVHAILLGPLPYPRASELVQVKRRQIAYYITPAQLDLIRARCPALGTVAGYVSRRRLLTDGSVPKRIEATLVSSDYFSVLGTPPLLGRSITGDDTRPGHDQVAVLSYGLWTDRFGADPGILGRTIGLDHTPYIVVGVMPREFGVGVDWVYSWRSRSDDGVWLPRLPASAPAKEEGSPRVIGRLRPGATLAQLRAQLQPLSDQFLATYRRKDPVSQQLTASALTADVGSRVSLALVILWGAAILVLLMTCTNVASLLVARAWTRQRELAIRRALGASRGRLLRQLSAESLLLALAGGGCGVLLSVWGIRLLRAVAPPFTPRLDRVVIDDVVLWFTVGLSLLVAGLVGFAPAWRAVSSRVGRPSALGDSFAALTMRRPDRLRNALVALQIALAVVVVAAAGLMGRSFHRLMTLDTGITSPHVLTLRVEFSQKVCGAKSEATTCRGSTDALLDGVRALPGVRRAALYFGGPFEGGMVTGHYPGSEGSGLYLEGLTGDRLEATRELYGRGVTADYFGVFGMRVLEGRRFEPTGEAGRVAIVSERFARRHFAGHALGKRFATFERDDGGHNWMEIVGVVNDVRNRAAEEPPGEVYYVPLSLPIGLGAMLAVQTGDDPTPLVASIGHLVRTLDRDAPIEHVRTVESLVSESASIPRFLTALVGSFGVLSLVLAILGVYGVLSFSVVQRTHEIGVRMALGAGRHHVVGAIIRQGMGLALGSIAVGTLVALGVTRVLRSVLFEIQPTDPVTFVGVAVLLSGAALAACGLPARRATRVDPVVTLRHD